MKKRFKVVITQEVEVEVDETKFTQEFLDNFSNPFHKISNLQRHMQYLAVACVHDDKQVLRDSDTRIESYGPAKDLGIVVSFLNPPSAITKEIE